MSYAPASDEGQLRFLLAESLQGVIHQELLPTLDGGRRVGCEILVVTMAAKNILRRKGGFQLRSVVETGQKHGMITMQQSLKRLVDERVISEDVANSVGVNYR